MMDSRPTTSSMQRRVERLESRILDLKALDSRFSWMRLIIFLAGTIVSLFLLAESSPLGWLTALVSIILFSIVVSRHHAVQRTLSQFRLWRELKLTHNARQQIDWSKLPHAMLSSLDGDHPYEADLNLTGDRSLHHLLDTTVAFESAVRLRNRLLTTPPDIQTILNRQALVRELVPLTYLRDRLSIDARLAVKTARQHWDTRSLSQWFASPGEIPRLRLTVWLAAALALVNIVLFILNQAGILPPIWAITFIAYVAVSLTQLRYVTGSFEQAMSLYDALSPLVEVAHRLESYSFTEHPNLKRLVSPFQAAERPSAQLRRLSLIASAASITNHMLAWAFLNALVPWELFVAYQLNRYRRDLADYVPLWLDTWFELETTSALATFAALHPDYHFPQTREDAIFAAHQLGHPLIPASARVSNDLTIGKLGEVLLITGSNMSGKSSFLRTLGINLALAYAGSAVCADSLEIGLFRVFTCIQVNDSINDGFSYFYAEVHRLKALLDALEKPNPLPLFFLIDEIFRATNNQERLIGSRAYIQALLGKHGIGAISTHDLELAQLAGLINFHFEDQVSAGEMTFDYRLRPGPSPTTNALKIMRLAGLPVEDETRTPAPHP